MPVLFIVWLKVRRQGCNHPSMAKGHVSEAYKEMAEHSGMLLYNWVRQYIHRGIEILSGEVFNFTGQN